MSQGKESHNGPALAALRAIGYPFRDILTHGVRDGFILQSPQGSRIRVKIQKRNGTERAAGQHRFGVCYRDFGNVDAFVFWIRGLNRLLFVPCARLTSIFQAHAATNCFTQPRQHQWEVVFHFTESKAFIEPIGSKTRIEISDCCHQIPQLV
jgi:hypothetical protein